MNSESECYVALCYLLSNVVLLPQGGLTSIRWIESVTICSHFVNVMVD